MANEKRIWDNLIKAGFTEIATAGIMGNIQSESAFKPNNLQNSYEEKLNYTDVTYTEAVDAGTYKNFVKDGAGYGLCQWTYWSRKENLLNFMKGKKLSIGDLDGQCEFLVQELKGYKLFDSLNKCATVREASDIVLLKFEKPRNQSETVCKKRADNGEKLYSEFAQKTPVQSTNNDKYIYYTVIKGDNLTKISKAFNTTVKYLKDVNGIANANLIKVGQVLIVGEKANNPTVKPEASTTSKMRDKVVETANAWMGATSGSEMHKQILAIYNSQSKLPRGHKMVVSDAWCACFVSTVALQCGLTDIIPTECSCGKMIELFRQKNEWIERDDYVPQKGDIIFFYWQDNGVGECDVEHASHVGIVEKCDGKTITTIEGNYNNAVRKRNIAVNGRYIRGFAVPAYADEPKKEIQQVNTESKPKFATINTSGLPLRLRKAGSLTAQIITTIPNKTIVRILDDSNKEWYKVQFKDIEGYCAAAYLKTI